MHQPTRECRQVVLGLRGGEWRLPRRHRVALPSGLFLRGGSMEFESIQSNYRLFIYTDSLRPRTSGRSAGRSENRGIAKGKVIPSSRAT